MRPLPDDLVYDWNADPHPGGADRTATVVDIQDETLRDGAQSASVLDPATADKRAFLHHAAGLGIQSVNLGFPAAGTRAAADVLALAREILAARLPLTATCAARMSVADVDAITDASQAAGVRIEVATFIGASGIRRLVEGWTVDDVRRRVEAVVTRAVRAGHDVMFVTEDTTRTAPDTLVALYGTAISAGARRICLADTVGHATPDGVRRLVRFVRDTIVAPGGAVAIGVPGGAVVAVDWHGHRDRGLGLANCLAAIEAGADRVHATALGLGERAGNVEMETLLLNLRLMGRHRSSLATLPAYARHAAQAFGVAIPDHYPVVGADAFTTGTGTHAAAILKAREQGDAWVTDHVYALLPARDVGRTLDVRVGPYSGGANARWWLADRGYDVGLADTIVAAAKTAARALRDDEIEALVGAKLVSSSARPDARSATPAARA